MRGGACALIQSPPLQTDKSKRMHVESRSPSARKGPDCANTKNENAKLQLGSS
jgi:hypothetical protein